VVWVSGFLIISHNVEKALGYVSRGLAFFHSLIAPHTQLEALE
jgi:hypothetical protein